MAMFPCFAWPSFAPAQEPSRFELTPYAAFRFGGEFDEETGSRNFDLDEHAARGLIFNVRATAVSGFWEVFYAHQPTALETQPVFAGGPLLDIDVDYLHFGGVYLFDGEAARPFIGLTAGVTHFDPGLPGFNAETYASGSLGGGIQLRANERIGVRLEGRVFASLVDSDGELFCRSGPQTNACALVVDGTALVQWEARAGVVFRF
jgi:hypothetical protein